MNHTAGEVAIISSRLKGRIADAQAIAARPVATSIRSRGMITAVLTAAGDPLESSARTFAIAKNASLIVLSTLPIKLTALERQGRPLGYLSLGAPPGPPPGLDAAGARAQMLRLIRAGGPGEIAVADGFDPLDPGLVWLDPYERRRISLARALEIAGDVLRARSRTVRRSHAVGITRWKRPIVRGFLDGEGGATTFSRSPEAAAAASRAGGGRVVAWASRPTDRAAQVSGAEGVAFGRLEDGFLRSVGLGAAFVRPLSLVLDDSGVYYDPSRPSDLETLLAEADIPEDLRTRAAALRRRLVAEGVTKYNVGEAAAPVVPDGRFGVLVPGQVEDDASILKGAGAVRTNRDLLAAVRARRPDAFVVYKPHPDVVAGYRRGAVAAEDLRALADAVVVGGSIALLYPQCRAVETITSLSGFEALLRGLDVTTHGQPFYAGWGLTEDLAPHPRRGRARTLDELVAAALILYPLYRDPVSGLPCGPEVALDRLAAARARAATPAGRLAARLRHGYALTRHMLLGPIARRLR